MILRALVLVVLIAVCAVVAVAALALVAYLLRPAIAFIAADERRAWGTVAALLALGLLFVMEGKDNS